MLNGKGMYIWKVRHLAELLGKGQTITPTVDLIVEKLLDAGMTHAWIKIAEGSGRYNIYNGRDYAKELVLAMRKRGLSAWGWQYVYGRYPDYEARAAIQRLQELDLDGFVVDAEVEYKQSGANAAKRYMVLLRQAFPDLPIGLSSFRFPSFHREFPFDAFLAYCDFNAPQVYWMGATNAGAQLQRCLNEFKTIVKVQRPVFPTGAAYHERGWQSTAAQVLDFMQTAKELGLCGFNFWEMANCLTYMPDVWEMISDFRMTGDGGPVTEEPGDGEEGPGTGDEGPGAIHPKAQVVSDVVTLRSGPGTIFPEIRKLKNGDVVDVLDIVGSSAWLLVSRNPDRYIAAYYGNKRYVRLMQNG